MSGMVRIRQMVPADALAIERQSSQRMQLGIDHGDNLSLDLATDWVENGEAWTAETADGRVLALMGLRETFAGLQGVAWAILAAGMGPGHLAVSRHARLRIASSPLRRIEAICSAGVDAEAILTAFPDLDPVQLLEAVLAVPSPETRWAAAVGMTPVHVLRMFGAASETHVLFERIA